MSGDVGRGTGGLNYRAPAQRAASTPTVDTSRPCLVSRLPAPAAPPGTAHASAATGESQKAERATDSASGSTATSRSTSAGVVVHPSENRNDCVASPGVRPIANSTSLG